MKLNHLVFPILAMLLVLLITACGNDQADEQVVDTTIRPAKIFRVTTQEMVQRHQFIGRVEAARTVDMSFQVPGLLQQYLVREGQEVLKGTLLATLDPEDYELAVREARVQLNIAEQDLKRKASLLRDRGISESMVDDARALRDLRQVHLEQAVERLEDTRLLAPFSGYVSRRFVDGQVNIQAAQPVLRLLDLNTLNIVTSIPEDLVATVTADRIASLQADFSFAPGQTFALRPLENAGEAGSVAQTYEVTFQMDRPSDWNVLPGMTATVNVELNNAGNSTGIVIPENALVAGAGDSYHVWLYDPATGNVARRQIQVGVLTPMGVQIRQGLNPGDLLVAAGAQQLIDGMRVRPLNADY